MMKPEIQELREQDVEIWVIQRSRHFMPAIGAFWAEKVTLFLQRSGKKERIVTTQEIPPHFYSQDWGIKMTGMIPLLMGAHETIDILTHNRRCWDSYTSYSLNNNVKVTVDFLNNFFPLSLNNTSTLELLFLNISHWLLITDSLSRYPIWRRFCLIVLVFIFYSEFQLIVISILHLYKLNKKNHLILTDRSEF